MHRAAIIVLAALATGILGAPAPAVADVPVIPNDVPGFPAIAEHPTVTVTLADGSPVTGATVHRGDVLLVHGAGFDPGANRGGFPFPIPPGVPNGVYALYSAFPPQWRPSADAPAESRTHPHSAMAWLITPEALAAIPRAPIDMHRSIARVAQPMNPDGTFTARVTVDPPAVPPGDRWGVYVYPAAGAVNADEEFYIPIGYSPAPGPNTPPAPSDDLILDGSVLAQLSSAAGGALTASRGAQRSADGRVGFTRAADAGDGIVRYTGRVTATARYNAVEVALADPWLEPQGATVALTALISDRYDVGADEMHRRTIATLDSAAAGIHESAIGPVEIHR